MMHRLLLLVASAVLLLSWPLAAGAAELQDVYSPAEVVDIDRELDGSTIVVEGEAVGDVLRTMGGGSWVNVLGDEVGLGVWFSDDEMVEQIEYLGNFHQDGDMVQVTGVVNVTCPQHGGEFDLHAEELEILESGQPREQEPVYELAIVGAVGVVIGGALLFRYRSVRD
jgi:hypothetical protein